MLQALAAAVLPADFGLSQLLSARMSVQLAIGTVILVNREPPISGQTHKLG